MACACQVHVNVSTCNWLCTDSAMAFHFLRISDAMMLKTEDCSHMIIKPIQFHCHVIRKLSDWCSVIPDISIDAELPSLEVQLGPGDYSAILSLMNSLSDGRSTTQQSIKGASDGGEETKKVEVERKNEEIAIPTASNGATSSDHVKLFMKFQMKEVIGDGHVLHITLVIFILMYR